MLISSGIYNLLILLTLSLTRKGENVVFQGFIGNSPFHFILYSALVIAFAWLLIRSQTRSLIRTRKLLKEKELALSLIENQRAELEHKNKNITDSLIYAQRIQDMVCRER
jgi:hypothetical protein